MRARKLNTAFFRVENCGFERAAFQDSKIGRIEIVGTTISRHVDFSRTQAKEQNINLAPVGSKLEGSNIKLKWSKSTLALS